MNIKALLEQYFKQNTNTTIDAFDMENIYDVYQRIIKELSCHFEIEVSVLQGLSYCFYEILDNVLTHSEKKSGVAITNYNPEESSLGVLIADDGIGIWKSLKQNEKFLAITEEEALKSCINDKVTDGKGMGFGLYSTSILAKKAAMEFEIRSGESKLYMKNGEIIVAPDSYWQGTIVFMKLYTNNVINPSEIVAYRTDCTAQYNESFIDNENLEKLW